MHYLLVLVLILNKKVKPWPTVVEPLIVDLPLESFVADVWSVYPLRESMEKSVISAWHLGCGMMPYSMMFFMMTRLSQGTVKHRPPNLQGLLQHHVLPYPCTVEGIVLHQLMEFPPSSNRIACSSWTSCFSSYTHIHSRLRVTITAKTISDDCWCWPSWSWEMDTIDLITASMTIFTVKLLRSSIFQLLPIFIDHSQSAFNQ